MATPTWGLGEVIAAGCGPVVKVWEPSAPQRAVKINEGTPVYSVAFSHNNKVLAVAGEKGQAALYGGKGASPEAGAQLAGHMPSVPVESSDSITCITFMPNDSCLVGGCLNGVVHLWMLKEEDSASFEPLAGSVTSVAVAMQDAMAVVAASSASGQVVLHGISDGTNPAKKLKTLLQKGTRTGCLGFAQGQPSLLCCAKDSGQLLVWDINHVAQGPTEIGVHRAIVTGCQFSPEDYNLLISCGQDGLLAATDRRSKQLAWKAELQQPLSAISMRWDGSMVAVGTSSGSVLLHDTRSVSTKLPLQQFSAEQPVTALCWQHMPATRGSRGRHSLGTAQAAGSSVAPAGHADTSGSNKPAPAAAASRPAQPQQRGNGAAPAASSKPAVPPHKVPLVLPSAWDGTTPQSQGIKSTASSSSDTGDFGPHVLSPMRLYASPLESNGDAASHSTGTAGQLGAAGTGSAGPGALHTPEQGLLHTPADSSASGAGFRGPVMFTPMMGFAGNMDSSTPLGLGADVTPVSRLISTAAAAGAADNPVLGRAAAGAAAAAAAGRTAAGSRPPDSSMLRQGDTASGRLAGSSNVAAADTAGPGSRPSNAAADGSSHRRKTSDPAVSAAASAKSAAAGSKGRPATAPSGSGPADGVPAAGDGTVVITAAAAAGTARNSKVSAGDAAAGAAPGQPTAKPPAAGASKAAASRPPSSSAAAVAGVTSAALREDVFKACIDELRAEQDERFAQLFQTQAELVAAMNSLAARQEQLVDAITQLSTHVSSLSSQQQEQQQQEQHKHLPQPGVSTIPWI